MTAPLHQEAWQWRRAMMRLDLPASAFRVAIALVDVFLNRKSGLCFPSQETIAETTGLSISGVRKALAALREAGLLATTKRQFNGSLSYAFLIPEPLRSAPNGTVRDGDEVPQTGHTNRPKRDARSDPNGAIEVTEMGHLTIEDNQGTEPSNRTFEVSSSYGSTLPGFAVFADASTCSNDSLRESFEREVSYQRDGQRSDFLSLEEGPLVDIDEFRLGDAAYVAEWLCRYCPDGETYRAIIRLSERGELQAHHLLEVAA